MQKLLIGLGVLGFLVAGFSLYSNVMVPKTGSSSPDHYFPESFKAGITVGGGVLATSSQGAATYTAAQIINNKLITQTAPGALTVTLPASSTFSGSFIPKPGDTFSTYIAGVTTLVTVAAGSGETLLTASSTKQIAPGGIARLEWVRKSNSDILVLFTTAI